MAKTAQQTSGQEVVTQQSAPPAVSAVNEFMADLASYRPQLEAVLPPHIPVRYYERVLLTAVGEKPELLYANRRTLFLAAVKCAADGLLPDGREAFLNVYNTKVKQRGKDGIDREIRLDVVQYQPMVHGIRKRMRESGQVLSAIAEAVFEKDEFEYELGDDPYIKHKPASFLTDRGKVIGAYAIIRLANGEVIRDVMDWPAIETSRNQNRYWSTSLMWTKFPWEGAKKTVLIRASKQAPKSSGFERFHDEEDHAEAMLREAERADQALPAPTSEPEPEPTRQEQRTTQPEPEERDDFAVVDQDGVESLFNSASRARDALLAVLEAAAKTNAAAVAGMWESNGALLDALSERGAGDLAQELATEYTRLHDEAKARDEPKQEQQQGGGEPSPTDAPADEGDRPSLRITPHKDLRIWAMAQFLPKVRRTTDARTLAFLNGDNSDTIEAAKKVLGKDDLADFQRTIEAQWRAVGGNST